MAPPRNPRGAELPIDEKENGVPGHNTPHDNPQRTRIRLGRSPRQLPRRAACAAFSVAAAALLLAACSTAPDPASSAAGTSAPAGKPAVSATPGARTPPAVASAIRGSYVALGDSYTAGPDIPDQTGATAGCDQSSSSYPYLVARSLRLKLTDVSCSSATIASLTAPQPTGDGTNPAQLSALSPATAFVTLGIGGNDVGWVAIITRCSEMDLIPALIPGNAASGPTPCQDYYTSGGTNVIEQRIQSVEGPLGEALTQIRNRAPRARLYVVGYPDLFPAAGGGCTGSLALTKGDAAFLNNEELRFNAMLRHVAPLHPNAVGEQGMADAIIAAIKATG